MTTDLDWRSARSVRVRFGALKVPLWLLGIVVGAFGALVGLALSPVPRPRPAPPTAAPAPPEPEASIREVAASNDATPEEPPTTLDRARRGDLASLKRLEREKKHTPESELAILEGRLLETRTAASVLRRDFGARLELAEDQHARGMLREAVRHTLTAVDALATMVELPKVLGPDLLDETASARDIPATIASTAARLLETDAVRARASEALLIKLDLARATTCDEKKRLVTRAMEVADARTLKPLEELGKETGCGKNASEDCFPCLRGDDLLARARESARGRKAPRF